LFFWQYRLDGIRSAIFAVGLAFAATSLFEIIYQNVGVGTGVGNQAFEGQLINLSSIALVVASLRFWRVNRVFLSATILFLCGWLFWLAFGYPQIYNPSSNLAQQAYVFNASLKVGAFVLVALLVSFAGPRPEPRDNPVPSERPPPVMAT
jgi:hypothetical protein